MPSDLEQRRPTGSRLSQGRETELFTVVLELLRQVGYDALTMDAVASRTRASKATLYRRWSGKPQLVVAALNHHKPLSFDDIDTGSLRGDLLEAARRMGRAAAQDSMLLAGLAHVTHYNPELAQALRERLLQPEADALADMLRRAVGRGELGGDEPAAAFLPHLLFSAVVSRPLHDGQHADEHYLTDLVDAVVLPALHLT